MNAAQVRAYVQAKWPQAMQSPVAQAIAVLTHDEHRALGCQALNHALACLETCSAQDIDYDEETLSNNIASNFPELDDDECDAIARQALAA